MEKSILKLLVLVLTFAGFMSPALGSDSLRCYSFLGVKYQTKNLDSQLIEIDDTTKIMFDQTIPITNQRARLIAGNDQLQYDADYDGKYFRMELTDRTNGQSNTYFGPSSSFAVGVDTSLFVGIAKDSTMKASWDDLEHQIGDVLPESLQATYATVQCNKILE